MLTSYGKDVYITIFVVSILLVLVLLKFIHFELIKQSLLILIIAFNLFTIYFFRDPVRTTLGKENSIISPADGKIIAIRTVFEERFFKEDATMISIFMSPFNVHVNRIPIDGEVKYLDYIKGEYFAAFEEKASLKNEQSHIGIENNFGKIFFKQIAGFIARRIVFDLKSDQKVVKGEKFGMIKFGSRVDIFLPKSAKIFVNLDDKTIAGETVLAEF